MVLALDRVQWQALVLAMLNLQDATLIALIKRMQDTDSIPGRGDGNLSSLTSTPSLV